MGLETNPGPTFSLSGPRYFKRFLGVATRRISEGFRMFKFDGIGGGLGKSGAGSFTADFEAMLFLISQLRSQAEGPVLPEVPGARAGVAPRARRRRRLWINLTIGTWPSLFWLLWADSIWRDGVDVGLEGEGSLREKWLTFRDASVLRALRRGPTFPLPALMQHGVVWSRVGMAADMWDKKSPGTEEDFRKEVLTFFLSGVGLQELYLQVELMGAQHWDLLAEAATFARRHAEVLQDAHWIGGNPSRGEVYGVASFGPAPRPSESDTEGIGNAPPVDHSRSEAHMMGIFFWRNPTPRQQRVRFSPAVMLELPADWLGKSSSKISSNSADGIPCWTAADLELSIALGPSSQQPLQRVTDRAAGLGGIGAFEDLELELGPFDVRAFQLQPSAC
mmetsp:Transcript_16812/g.48026  ORF Transcript_16812/g.48026 Transcript_16812/m.48026 type:complete len:391 (+) Transcript_16812:77-1249(+)